MTTLSIPKVFPSNVDIGSTINRSAYLERIEEAISRVLLKMEPYDENAHVKDNPKREQRLPFYPHVELETASIEREHIEDTQKIRPFGKNTTKSPHAPEANAAKTNPLEATRKRELCLIESTSNSVRISFLFKMQTRVKVDPLEASIVFQWMRFLIVQEKHPLLRKTPIEGYSVTFLVTNKQLKIHGRQKVQDSILGFCAKIDKECSDIKLQVNAQARYVTTAFLKAFNNSSEEVEGNRNE